MAMFSNAPRGVPAAISTLNVLPQAVLAELVSTQFLVQAYYYCCYPSLFQCEDVAAFLLHRVGFVDISNSYDAVSIYHEVYLTLFKCIICFAVARHTEYFETFFSGWKVLVRPKLC